MILNAYPQPLATDQASFRRRDLCVGNCWTRPFSSIPRFRHRSGAPYRYRGRLQGAAQAWVVERTVGWIISRARCLPSAGIVVSQTVKADAQGATRGVDAASRRLGASLRLTISSRSSVSRCGGYVLHVRRHDFLGPLDTIRMTRPIGYRSPHWRA